MTSPFTIRQAKPEDDAARAALLAPTYDADAPSLAAEMAVIRDSFHDFGDLAPGLVCLVAVTQTGQIVGAAEATVRLYANGCEDVRVLFLEGIAVAETHQQAGVAAALLAQIEDMARQAGITELASDAQLDDAAGMAFHRAFGFAEVERVACFVRRIAD